MPSEGMHCTAHPTASQLALKTLGLSAGPLEAASLLCGVLQRARSAKSFEDEEEGAGEEAEDEDMLDGDSDDGPDFEPDADLDLDLDDIIGDVNGLMDNGD